MYSNAASIFILLQMFPKFYKEYNLVWKQGWSIRKDEKGFHSPIFLLDESHCIGSMFV